jgi:hypothetical protein
MKTSLKNPAFTLLLFSSVFFALWGASYFLSDDVDQSFVETGSTSGSGSGQSSIPQERIIYRGDPPYLTELPILDGNLFVNHSDDFLLFGGENIEQVRFSAGTRAGGRATIEFHENSIAYLMAEQPYIEFSYQEKFYSLQILSRAYFFTMDFREIPTSSIELTNRFEAN